MIKIEETEVWGWKGAIRGMRNPMNSWDKSDSEFGKYSHENDVIGEADFTLMKKLVSAGSDHSKFMRMIHVQLDITAPLYWWKEFDTYKVGTVANSCSTMHKIHAKEFTLDDFSCEHMHSHTVDVMEVILNHLNISRYAFIASTNKKYWWQMIQLLPSSYNQRRTIDLNYAVLRNMYHARKNHRLDEWHDFCKWIEELPYSELITMGGNNHERTDEH